MQKYSRHDLITNFIISNRDSIFRLVKSYVRNEDDALDIIQDAIYKALDSEKTLMNPAALKAWIYRIVVNTALDFLRKKKYHVYLEDEALPLDVPGSHDLYEDFDLKKAVSNLSTVDKTLIILRFYEDLRLEEIAVVLNLNVNTVKTRLYSCLKKLRIELEDPDRVLPGQSTKNSVEVSKQ